MDTTNETHLNTRQGTWSLVGVVFIVLVVWASVEAATFGGFKGSDDFHYMRFAWFWDRAPVDHWETRLLFNGVLRLSFLLFGFSQISAALPNLLASLLVLASGMYLALRFWRSHSMVLLTGLLLACLPINLGSNPNARPLATGFAAAGFAVLLGGNRIASAIAAGVLLAMGVLCHVAVIFFVGVVIAVVALMKLRSWRHCVLAFGVAAALFAAGEFGTFYLWTSDPFHGFHIASRTHLENLVNDPDLAARGSGVRFLWLPVRDLLLSLGFGALGLAAIMGTALRWKSLRRPGHAMVWIVVVTWAWMSYGTQTPARYLPFPMTVAYWHVLAVPLALIVAAALVSTRRLLWLGIPAGLIAMNFALMGLSGPWGQSVKVSRELLAYAQTHPERAFVSDNMTLTELYVLNRFRSVPNVRRLPGTPSPKFWDAEPLRAESIEAKPVLALFNPLNSRGANASYNLLANRLGDVVHQGEVHYRPTTYLLPASYRRAHPWTIRRPAAQVRVYKPEAL